MNKAATLPETGNVGCPRFAPFLDANLGFPISRRKMRVEFFSCPQTATDRKTRKNTPKERTRTWGTKLALPCSSCHPGM